MKRTILVLALLVSGCSSLTIKEKSIDTVDGGKYQAVAAEYNNLFGKNAVIVKLDKHGGEEQVDGTKTYVPQTSTHVAAANDGLVKGNVGTLLVAGAHAFVGHEQAQAYEHAADEGTKQVRIAGAYGLKQERERSNGLERFAAAYKPPAPTTNISNDSNSASSAKGASAHSDSSGATAHAEGGKGGAGGSSNASANNDGQIQKTELSSVNNVKGENTNSSKTDVGVDAKLTGGNNNASGGTVGNVSGGSANNGGQQLVNKPTQTNQQAQTANPSAESNSGATAKNDNKSSNNNTNKPSANSGSQSQAGATQNNSQQATGGEGGAGGGGGNANSDSKSGSNSNAGSNSESGAEASGGNATGGNAQSQSDADSESKSGAESGSSASGVIEFTSD